MSEQRVNSELAATEQYFLCRDISQLSSAGEERLFGSLDST